MCDLAEWGVVIDNPEKVQSIKEQYWDPMWKASYFKDDCEVDKVMDGLNIDRDAANPLEMTAYQVECAQEKMRAEMKVPMNSRFHRKKKDSDSDADDSSQSSAEE